MTALLLILLGLSAQTHPCDGTWSSGQTIRSGAEYRVEFCALASDQPEAFTLYVNSVASDLRPLTLLQQANSAGYALYTGPRELRFPRGEYVLEMTLWNTPYPGAPAVEGGRSSPFRLAVVDDLPSASAPMILRLAR